MNMDSTKLIEQSQLIWKSIFKKKGLNDFNWKNENNGMKAATNWLNESVETSLKHLFCLWKKLTIGE